MTRISAASFQSSRRSSTISNASKPLKESNSNASATPSTDSKSTVRMHDYNFLASLPEIDIPFLVECNNFLLQFPDLGDHYIPIAKIGEGKCDSFYLPAFLPIFTY